MTANTLRTKFLNFFKARKHRVVESDSLVPAGDPTVLFTPAGMNQFKKQFMGIAVDFSRAATAQRCLRTDDLDKVGKTSGHHTFFEMLGNFSFGDYFKKEAISWAWEFLTQELKIAPEKLWVSVYRDDDEAYGIWKDIIKVPQERIVKLGDKDNFWPAEAKQKGPNGPCGPCSEIFYDFGAQAGCKTRACDPSCSCGRFVEIWNLVFTQFNRKEGGVLEPLPKKNIDTGMGLERLAALMQGAKNNFETELFQPLVREIARQAKRPLREENLFAISDHIRAVVFAIYDGVLPSNEERGYVVRKLIRKSLILLGALGVKTPYLYKLVALVCEIMKEPYPLLNKRKEEIAAIVLAEEKNFLATLSTADSLLVEKFKDSELRADPLEAGRTAFMLYDTYGIPLELISEWLQKHKIKFSREAFDLALKEQKERSKSKSAMKGDVFAFTDFALKEKQTKFVGYRDYQTKAKILKIFREGREVKKLNPSQQAQVILDQTPFYPESGGQVGDTGKIFKGKNLFEVTGTQKLDKIIIHSGVLKQGSLKKSDLVSAEIDVETRLSTARNHTATHLLQAALRKVLGTHVQQQGSLVEPQRMRFDFTHFKELSKEELQRVEEEVYNYVIGNFPVSSRVMPLKEAKKSGALAFFAEKYDQKVRVVSVEGLSREFCAGTHLDHTGQIGLFKIIHEGSVASGVRRIEACTGKPAYRRVKLEESLIDEVSAVLNVPSDKIAAEAERKLSRAKELEKELGAQKIQAAKSELDNLIQEAQKIRDVLLITRIMPESEMNILRKTVDLLKEKTDNAVIALGSVVSGRPILVMGVTADLCAKGVDASVLINEVAKGIGGSGGGRKDFAQAGGSRPEGLAAAFEKLKELIGNLP